MKKYIAVFRSRTDVMSFIYDMKKSGAYCSTIPTPPSANIGCGISAEFLSSSINIARKLIISGKYKSFHSIIVKNSS